MNNDIEYYKSLISDEEVISALIKDSKERDGELPKEKTRVRPNVNFFQRTVTNLVSSNKRVSTIQEKVLSRERKKFDRKIKTPHDLIKETATSNKLKTVIPKDGTNAKLKENLKNYIEKKRNKIQQLKRQQLKKEALEQKQSIGVEINTAQSKPIETKNVLQDAVVFSSDSDVSVVSISSSGSRRSSDNDIVKLSDSDSGLPEKNETKSNSLNKTSKVKQHKKRKS